MYYFCWSWNGRRIRVFRSNFMKMYSCEGLRVTTVLSCLILLSCLLSKYGWSVRTMKPLSFCANKYYTNTANSIQFSEKRSQFPGIHNATRLKGRGQHTHKSTSLSDNCSWFPAWCSWRFTVKQIRSFKWSYFCRTFVKPANVLKRVFYNREHILRWCYK